MAIVSTQLTTSNANVVYGTSTSTKAVTALYLCNVTGATQTANVFLVPAGTDPAQCRIYSNISIAGFDSYIADTERIILEAGDSIWANCSATSAIVMTLSTAAV
jgi:hypothetical protein